MDQEQLSIFCKELLILKEKLKCSICLCVIEEHAELECGHRFCLTCLTEHKKNKESSCPICKTIIRRRSFIYKDIFADKIGSFVSAICKDIEKNESCSKAIAANLNEPSTSKKGLQNKCTKNKEEKEYKILNFHDNANKDAVVNWLNDNRNKFDRLTQTQHKYEEQKTENTPMELPSVSQIWKDRGRKSNPPKKQNRARSLDIEIKPKKEKRRSDGSVIGAENYKIEEINTEEVVNKAKENVLLHIIEDEYLNKMEHELHKKKDNTKNNPEVSQASTTDWQRIKNISKTLRKKEKVPKKLNVTVQQSQNSRGKRMVEKILKIDINRDDTIKNVIKDKRKEIISPKKVLGEILENAVPTTSTKEDQSPPVSKINAANMEKAQDSTNFYNLDDFEKYAEQNMKNIPKELNESNISQSSNKENNESLLKNTKEPQNIVILENIIINEIVQEDEVDPYKLPTQKINLSDQNLNNKENILVVTQPMDAEDSFSDESETVQGFNELMSKLVNNLQTYSENLDKKKQLTKRHIQSIQNYLDKLNKLYTVAHIQHVDQYVQTEKTMMDSEVQTDEKIYNNVEIQTLFTQNVKCFSRTNSNTPKLMQNDDFAASLDLLNFETQEIEKQYRKKKICSSPVKSHQIILSDVGKTADDLNKVTQNIPIEEKDDNQLECTLKSTKRLSSKRTLSDSDSSDVIAVPKRRCNRFIRDDLSIEFGLSENPKKQKRNSFTTELSIGSDDENDEDYLNRILKKYENGTSPNTQSNKENVSMEVDLDIVNCVNENVIKLSKLNPSSKSSYKTASQLNPKNDLDDLFLNDQDLSKLDNEFKQYKDLKETDSSDIIPESEDMEPIPKKVKVKIPNDKIDSTVKPMKSTYCQELEDSLNGKVFENIQIENEKMQQKDNEDDLFSEDDYVESTPEKKDPQTFDKRSQLNVVANLSTRFHALDDIEKEIIENFDINFAPLSPPPGFEDDKNSTVPEDVTVINLNLDELPIIEQGENNKEVTGTPEKLSPLNIINRNVVHSTPMSQHTFPRDTLGLSPIVQEKNAFEKAFNSNTIISNITNQETPNKRNILTSFPKQRSILNYVKSSQISNSTLSSQKPCIACTRLSKDQIQSISLLTNKKLATYSAKFTESVTHLIVAVDGSRRIKDYTMKFVSAVASGIWVLGFEWIQECLRTNSIVPEDPYEVLDDSGNSGPKMARTTRLERPLFRNYKFFCVSPLYSTTVEDVEDVVTRLGGVMVKNQENIKENDGKIALIITEGRSTQDFEVYERWLEKYKVITVDIEWLSRSVGRYKILSVKPYIWCSDDNIENLGYPTYLIENTSCSSEQF